MEAMQAQIIDVVKRMKEITLVMQTPENLFSLLMMTVTVRTKALSAISWHNKPGIQVFLLANGFVALRDALSSDSVRFQRKALNLIRYLLQENPSENNIITELGCPRIMKHLVASEDPEVREGALGVFMSLPRTIIRHKKWMMNDDEKLKQVLQDRINNINIMSSEDLVVAREERQLLDSLWTTYYHEPSSLREKGLVVLPGDDAPPPDGASKVFESTLRPPVRPSGADDNSGKKEGPLLLAGADA